MSSSITSVINDMMVRGAGASNQNIYVELGKTGLSVTDMRVQYARVIKGTQVSLWSGPAVALTALGAWNSPHTDNAGFINSAVATDPSSSVLRFCAPDAAFNAGADAVIFSFTNVNDTSVRVSIQITIAHIPGLVTALEERGGVTSAIISKTGTPGNRRYTALYTEFVSTQYELGPEAMNCFIAARPSQGGLPEERQIIPVLGFYYSDGAGNYSQVNGIAGELGVGPITDLFAAGWTGADDESSSAGYTFILPAVDNFNPPDSAEDIALIYSGGQWGQNIRGADGYAFTDPNFGSGAFNWHQFWENSGGTSSKIVDDVGTGGGDWSVSEREQLRQALGITGTKSPTAAGDINTLLTQVGDIHGKLPSGDISGLQLSTEIDGAALTLGDCLELAGAMANGRFRKDVPSAGQITFYKRDNVTPLTIVGYSNIERTRVSP